MSRSNLLIILTGSIAAYKACDAISKLVQRGHRVRTVATPAALRFVGAATLEGLTGEPVATDLFEPGRAMDHIHLSRWADATLVCPATAHALNRFAAGLGDDLAGALLLAQDRTKPVLLAPAMNPAMWAHPATVAAVAKLESWGYRFIPVGLGRTACGEAGEGRLPEPAAIVAAVEAALVPRGDPLRVLVTSGGTAEPVDGVRVLTNTSTGRTGALLAAHFAGRGHHVVLLRARDATPAFGGCAEETFFTFADLDAALARLLATQAFDLVVHAAAVSDFRIEAVTVGGVRGSPGRTKLDSHLPVQLQLAPNPKLLDTLRGRSLAPHLRVVAFKLTQGADPQEVDAAVRGLLAGGEADFVVHNDLANRRGQGDDFPADIYQAGSPAATHCATRPELAIALERLVTASSSGS